MCMLHQDIQNWKIRQQALPTQCIDPRHRKFNNGERKCYLCRHVETAAGSSNRALTMINMTNSGENIPWEMINYMEQADAWRGGGS